MKKNIKKVFVSLLVIIGFAFYGIYQRFGDGFQKFFDNLQTRQVAAESYSDLSASSSKNQTSADPPVNISNNMDAVYTEHPSRFRLIRNTKLPIPHFSRLLGHQSILFPVQPMQLPELLVHLLSRARVQRLTSFPVQLMSAQVWQPQTALLYRTRAPQLT